MWRATTPTTHSHARHVQAASPGSMGAHARTAPPAAIRFVGPPHHGAPFRRTHTPTRRRGRGQRDPRHPGKPDKSPNHDTPREANALTRAGLSRAPIGGCPTHARRRPPPQTPRAPYHRTPRAAHRTPPLWQRRPGQPHARPDVHTASRAIDDAPTYTFVAPSRQTPPSPHAHGVRSTTHTPPGDRHPRSLTLDNIHSREL